MKYYLITEKVQDGTESEYTDFHLTKAESKEEAEKNAIAGILENYGKAQKDWDVKEERLELFDKCVELWAIKEIAKEDFETIKRVLCFFVV